MKDSDARGLVLNRLYDLRHQIEYANMSDFADIGVDAKIIPAIVEQLAQQDLVKWNPQKAMAGRYLALMAKITARGVDVIEGNTTAPIAITIDSSVNVHGSQNVQIGGSGNVQTVTMDIERMINAVDGANVSSTEKEEAKSLLKKISENKLVRTLLSQWVGGKFLW
jgi:hypothetical protein